MFIRADENGNVLLTSREDNVGCVEYKGERPVDFFDKVGLGKYKFIDGHIIEVEAWVMPIIDKPFI